MRNIWVAVIGVLALTMFAGFGSATAPVAQDIPDIRLLTDPASAVGTLEDFDLNDYVTDYDDDPTSLNWTIESQVDFDSGDPASLAGSLASLAGKAAADQGTATYRVADASEYSENDQVVKYSSFFMIGPSLTQDNNLVPPNTFKRTWVLQGDEALTTPALADLLSSAISADFTVSIADLAGEWLAGNNETDVTYGDINASISAGGELVLQVASGTYPLAGDQLTAAYRVGIKAKPAGGGLAGTEDNWDGAEILVSPSRFPTTSDANTTARVKRFNDFEITGTLPYTLPADQSVMRALADDVNPRWFTSKGTAGAAAQVVAAPPAGSPAWATSGQLLQVTLNAPTDLIEVYSEWFTDIEPGETLICEANVTTSAAAGGFTPTFLMFMGNFHIHSNYEGFAMFTPNDTDIQVPTGGAAGWRTMRVKFKADTLGADVNGFNFYERGYQMMMLFKGDAYGATYPFTFYVDNVRVYQAPDPIEAALGATKIDVTSQALSAPFDGTFEGATDLASAGFEVKTTENGGTSQVDVSGLNNMFSHDGSKALEVFVPGGLTSIIHTVYARLDLGSNAGPGLYGMTTWLKTNAGHVKDVPDVFVICADPAFRNAAIAQTGIVGLPLAGQGWKQVSVPSYRVGTTVNRLWAYFIVKTAGDLFDYPYWPEEFKGANQPGYESDARIYVDDIQIHKYQDDVRFFDRSVFPAAD